MNYANTARATLLGATAAALLAATAGMAMADNTAPTCARHNDDSAEPASRPASPRRLSRSAR